MKTKKTLLVFVCAFGIISSFSLAQSKDRPQSSESRKELKEEDKPGGDKRSNNELIGDVEKDPKSTNTKSFTLDANDAVLEDTIAETEELLERKLAEETTYQNADYNQGDEIQTLAGKESHHGGFGALTFRASEFNNKDIILAGLRGGWIINRALAIGFEGHGIIPTAEYENIDPTSMARTRVVGGYGGLFLEPIVMSNKVVHVTFPVAGGAGWLGYIKDWEQSNSYSNDLVDDDVFWYVEPGASMELNVARNFRMNLGASYRFTKELELINTSSSAFDGWNYFLTLKFGSF